MNQEKVKKISKFLSLVLRHQPEKIGIQLDESGWVAVDKLLAGMNQHGRPIITHATLEEVVQTNDKKRFSFSEDGQRIRANQGHSLTIELGYEPAIPPEILLHGTPTRFVDTIRKEGLKKMKRHHVHLHTDLKTATAVGNRRGQAVILKINSQAMHEAGYTFYVTPNDVWLVDQVPPEFITFP